MLKIPLKETSGKKLNFSKYFRATNAEKLGDIYEEIDVLEKTRFNVLRYQRKTEAYIGFLLIALGALLLEKVLSFTLIKSIS